MTDVADEVLGEIPGDPLPLKLQKLEQEVLKLRLANEQTKAELIPIDELNAVWARVLGAFRTSLLAIPQKVASHTDASADVVQEVRRLIDVALQDLSELTDGEEVPSDAPEGASTAASPDAE